MITPSSALSTIPDGLRIPLLDEFRNIVNNFMEHRWGVSELSGGRFCEIVYTILDGYAKGSLASAPSKPANFVAACKQLENNSGVPRSFQILIPRMIAPLYEIRNNRNVGHVGGDVDPDFMDSSAVVSICGWVLAELVRVLHGVSTDEAQLLVDDLAERRLPAVWKSGDIRRVLDTTLSLTDQTLLLVSSVNGKAKVNELLSWTEYKNKGYFKKTMRQLHKKRFIEFDEVAGQIEMLPPGSDYVARLLNGTEPNKSPKKATHRNARKPSSR